MKFYTSVIKNPGKSKVLYLVRNLFRKRKRNGACSARTAPKKYA